MNDSSAKKTSPQEMLAAISDTKSQEEKFLEELYSKTADTYHRPKIESNTETNQKESKETTTKVAKSNAEKRKATSGRR